MQETLYFFNVPKKHSSNGVPSGQYLLLYSNEELSPDAVPSQKFLFRELHTGPALHMATGTVVCPVYSDYCSKTGKVTVTLGIGRAKYSTKLVEALGELSPVCRLYVALRATHACKIRCLQLLRAGITYQDIQQAWNGTPKDVAKILQRLEPQRKIPDRNLELLDLHYLILMAYEYRGYLGTGDSKKDLNKWKADYRKYFAPAVEKSNKPTRAKVIKLLHRRSLEFSLNEFVYIVNQSFPDFAELRRTLPLPDRPDLMDWNL